MNSALACEWGSYFFNNLAQVVFIGQKCTDWLEAWLAKTGFMAVVQATSVRGDRGGGRRWVAPRDSSRTHLRTSLRARAVAFSAGVEWACLSPTKEPAWIPI